MSNRSRPRAARNPPVSSGAPRRPNEFNKTAARMLREAAELLKHQNANPFRVNAYRRAAETLESLDRDAREILRQQGPTALTALPFIGKGLAAAIEEIAVTGRLAVLERLRGAIDPERLFRTVPGIGPTLARSIHDTLDVDTLEALELAAHGGRLQAVPGIGPRRAAAIRAGLASLLARPRHRPLATKSSPSVEMLLDVDREYRTKADARRLPTVAPRRFNPEGKPWLPILHTVRQDWHFTALFSNTSLAHELGRTHDWVVIYFYDGDHAEGQHTVVTETHGPRKGRRVVRGRESEILE